MAEYLKQGELSFSTGYKIQRTWGFQESLIFFAEGVGATLASVFLWIGWWAGVWLGLGLLAAGALLLLMHLGHPEKFWRAFTMVRTSWISRGTVLLTGFFVLTLAALWLQAASASGRVPGVLSGLLSLVAVWILLYPGLFLSRSPSIPFWNSPLLPVLFLFQGITSGFSVLLLYLAWTLKSFSSTSVVVFLWVQLGALVLLLLLTGLYVQGMLHAGAATRESAQLLVRGELSRMFIIWGVGVGMLLPALLTALALLDRGAGVLLALVCAVAKLAGDLLYRHYMIKAGMYDTVF